MMSKLDFLLMSFQMVPTLTWSTPTVTLNYLFVSKVVHILYLHEQHAPTPLYS